MTTLVLGASGATGKHLVEQLVNLGQQVKVIVRPTSKIPGHWEDNPKLSIIKSNLSEMSLSEMANHLKDCHAVASCLGHNITFKGIYGKPRKLVRDAARLCCEAITMNAPEEAVKFVLMNTTANRNKDLKEPISLGEKLIMGLIRLLLPPQTDNEKAAEHFRVEVGQNNEFIEWVAVRPDGLIDEDVVSEYELHASPITSALFKPGKTSRINVGNFMARLIVEKALWKEWKGQMPVIYNK